MKPATEFDSAPSAKGPTRRPQTRNTAEDSTVLMLLRLACLMAVTLDTPLLSPFW